MIRGVLAYAENRLRMDPVPLDQGTLTSSELYARLDGVIGDRSRAPDEVLGIYASVIAPSVISADSPRFLGFIPAAPTKASLLFDMLVSCASIQGISWLEASGAIAAENTVLRLIADEVGLPAAAGGCFVSGGSAGNLSALAVARETAKQRTGRSGRFRVVVGTDAHSSIVNTLRLLEMDALVVPTPDHQLTAGAVRAALDNAGDLSDIAAVSCTSGTTNAGIVDDLAGLGALAEEYGWWFHVDGAYGGSAIFARSIRGKYDGIVGVLANLAAVGSALLMFHFLRCLLRSTSREPETTPRAALSLSWLATALASVVLPWALFPTLDITSWHDALAPGALWDALWPILVGGILAVALRQWDSHLPRIPAGDMLAASQSAFRAARNLGRAMERIDEHLRRWPVAGVLLAVCAVLMAGALLIGR
jgi:hypothetical protein